MQKEIYSWFEIIGGFGLFIGVYSLSHLHIGKIRRRVKGWGYSIFVFIGAGFMFFVGLYNGGAGPMAHDLPDKAIDWFGWGYEYVYNPAQGTIFAILAFFMASAAFRTFRARSVGATLLLVAAIIVMIGRVPISEPISQWLHLDRGAIAMVTNIIMNYPNNAAKRAIMLGISLGTIAQSIRILFGIERSYLGGSD